MENQLTVKEQNALSTDVHHEAEVLRSDLIVPYIVLGQGLSDAVVARQVQLGDIYRSTNQEVLGNPDKPIQAVLMGPPKADWVIEQKTGQKFEYRKSEPRHAGNDTLPWQYWADDDGNLMDAGQKGATEWRRVKRLTVFAILLDDIIAAAAEMKKVEDGELPDPSKALTPVVISFRSSSFKAGREVSTFYTKAKSMRADIWKYVITLGCDLDKNDQGSFYVWKVDTNKAVAVPKEHLPLVKDWVDMVNTRVDELNVDVEADTVSNGGSSSAPREVSQTSQEVC